MPLQENLGQIVDSVSPAEASRRFLDEAAVSIVYEPPQRPGGEYAVTVSAKTLTQTDGKGDTRVDQKARGTGATREEAERNAASLLAGLRAGV